MNSAMRVNADDPVVQEAHRLMAAGGRTIDVVLKENQEWAAAKKESEQLRVMKTLKWRIKELADELYILPDEEMARARELMLALRLAVQEAQDFAGEEQYVPVRRTGFSGPYTEPSS